jgi:cation transport ATPase
VKALDPDAGYWARRFAQLVNWRARGEKAVIEPSSAELVEQLLMRSDPLDVAAAITISRGTVRKMHQNLWWAVGYNSLALPIAASVFEPLGFVLRPEVAAISMAGSSVMVR